jgi:ferredoxin
MQVWVDQELCTGDGLCVQLAPTVFEFDVDGLAYVKTQEGQLLTDPGARAEVPGEAAEAVLDAVDDCPGRCIFVTSDPG